MPGVLSVYADKNCNRVDNPRTIQGMPQNTEFLPLTGTFEPSAIQQLPDGRFLVVEDEKQHPFSLVSISPDGSVRSTALSPGPFEAVDPFWKLDDLEALALDRFG